MEEIECKNFKFKQLSNVQISEAADYGDERYSLLCVSNEFGLTFVGTKDGVHVFRTGILHSLLNDESLKNKVKLSMLKSVLFPTPSVPVDVSLSCDNLTLSVCLKDNGMLQCLFFDTILLDVQTADIRPFCVLTLSTEPGADLSGLQWNPNQQFSGLLVVSLSTGILQLLSVRDNVAVIASNSTMHATSVCWSPKGKQVCVGLKTGEVLQLGVAAKFVEKKRHACPRCFLGSSMQVADIFWLSPYVFSVVYCSHSSNDDGPNLVFLSTPKGGSMSYVNAGDVYGGEGTKKNKFHFSYVNEWDVLISSSSNALETAVFGLSPEESDVWLKYDLDESARADLPIDVASDDETYALGMAIDRTSQQPLIISDVLTLPPCPLLLLYSNYGVLCPFSIINLDRSLEELQTMAMPPKPLPAKPIRKPVVCSVVYTSGDEGMKAVGISSSSKAKSLAQSTGSVQEQASHGFAPGGMLSGQPSVTTKVTTSTTGKIAMPGGGGGVGSRNPGSIGPTGLTTSLAGFVGKPSVVNSQAIFGLPITPGGDSKGLVSNAFTFSKSSPGVVTSQGGIGNPPFSFNLMANRATFPGMVTSQGGVGNPQFSFNSTTFDQPSAHGIQPPPSQPPVHGEGPPLHTPTPAGLTVQGNASNLLQHVTSGVSTLPSTSPVHPTASLMGVSSACPPVMGPQISGTPTGTTLSRLLFESPQATKPSIMGIPTATSGATKPPTTGPSTDVSGHAGSTNKEPPGISSTSKAKSLAKSTGSVLGQASHGYDPGDMKGLISTSFSFPKPSPGVVTSQGEIGNPQFSFNLASIRTSFFQPSAHGIQPAHGIQSPSSQSHVRAMGPSLGQPPLHGVRPPLHVSTPAGLPFREKDSNWLQYVTSDVTTCPTLPNMGLSTASPSFMFLPTVSPSTAGSSTGPEPSTAPPRMGVPSARPRDMGPQNSGTPTGTTSSRSLIGSPQAAGHPTTSGTTKHHTIGKPMATSDATKPPTRGPSTDGISGYAGSTNMEPPLSKTLDISSTSKAKSLAQSGSVQGQASHGSTPSGLLSGQPSVTTKVTTSTTAKIAMPDGGGGGVGRNPGSIGLTGLTTSFADFVGKPSVVNSQASKLTPFAFTMAGQLSSKPILGSQITLGGDSKRVIGNPQFSFNLMANRATFDPPSAHGIQPPSSQPPVHGVGPPMPPVHGVGPPMPPVHGVGPPMPPVHGVGPPMPPVHGVGPPMPPVHGVGPPMPPVHGVGPPMHASTPAGLNLRGNAPNSLQSVASVVSTTCPRLPSMGLSTASPSIMGISTLPPTTTGSSTSPGPPTASLMKVPSASPQDRGPQISGIPSWTAPSRPNLGLPQEAATIGIPTATSGATYPPTTELSTDVSEYAGSTNKEPPVTAAAQEQLDQYFASCISSAVQVFTEEVGGLRQLVSEVCCRKEGNENVVPGLGSLKDLHCIVEQVKEVQLQVEQRSHMFKRLQRLSEQQEEDVLRVCETQAQTKGAMSKSKDYNYAALQRLRPLDSISSDTLTKTRSKFLHMKHSLDEVMAELDNQLELRYEEKRQQGRDPMKVPSLHIIYSLLKDHHRISRLQKDEIERVMERMKMLKLIPHSWQPEVLMSCTPNTKLSRGTNSWNSGRRNAGDSHCMSQRLEAIAGRNEGGETKLDRSRVVQDDKVVKLQEYFENIHLAPIKKVATVPTLSAQPAPNTSELPVPTRSVQPAPSTSEPPMLTLSEQPAPNTSELPGPTRSVQAVPPTFKLPTPTMFTKPATSELPLERPAYAQPAPPTYNLPTPTMFTKPAPPTYKLPTLERPAYAQPAPSTYKLLSSTMFTKPAPPTYRLPMPTQPPPPTYRLPTPTMPTQPPPPTYRLPTPTMPTQPPPPTFEPQTLAMSAQPAPSTSKLPTHTMPAQPAPSTSKLPTHTMPAQLAPSTSKLPTPTMAAQPAPSTSQLPTPTMSAQLAPSTSKLPTPTMAAQPAPSTSKLSTPTMPAQLAPSTSKLPTPTVPAQLAPPTFEPLTLTSAQSAPPTSKLPTPTMFTQPVAPFSKSSTPIMSAQPTPLSSEPPRPTNSESIPLLISSKVPPTSMVIPALPTYSTKSATPTSFGTTDCFTTSTAPLLSSSTTAPLPPPSTTVPLPPPSTTVPLLPPSTTAPLPPPSTTPPLLPPSTTVPLLPPSTTAQLLPPSTTAQLLPPSTTAPLPPPSTTAPLLPPSTTAQLLPPSTTAPLLVHTIPGTPSSSLHLTTAAQSVSQSLLLNKPMQLADSQSSLVSAISTHDEDNDAMGDDMESTDSIQDGGKISLCNFGLGSTSQNPVSANPFASQTFAGGSSQSSVSTSAYTGGAVLRQSTLGGLAPSHIQSSSIQGGSFSDKRGGSSFGAKPAFGSSDLSFGSLPTLGGVSTIGPTLVDHVKKFGTTDSGLSFCGLAQQQGGGETGIDSSSNVFGGSSTTFGASNTGFAKPEGSGGGGVEGFGSGPSGMSGSSFTNWRR